MPSARLQKIENIPSLAGVRSYMWTAISNMSGKWAARLFKRHFLLAGLAVLIALSLNVSGADTPVVPPPPPKTPEKPPDKAVPAPPAPAKTAATPTPSTPAKSTATPNPPAAQPPLMPFEKDIQPILAATCYACHGKEKKKADLDLARFKTTASLSQGAEIWQVMIDRLKAKEMPPGKATQKLSEEDRLKLLKWLGPLPKAEVDCHKIATDDMNFYKGYVMSRRLGRAEYNNSIRDLFGIDLKVGDMFPVDGAGGEGFNNNGSALFISSIQIEKYLQAADKVLDTILPTEKDKAAGLTDELSAARKRLLSVKPSKDVAPKDAARTIVASFARRAFRRPVPDDEVNRLLTMYDRGSSRGDGFEASLKLALKAVLVSPNFLFMVEPEPEKEGIYQLGDFQLASRLSYFIWTSMPDDELLDVAKSGKLHEKEILLKQVKRMIADPRSKGLAESFASQWWGLEALNGAVKPDPKRFPEFDAELAESMRAEAILLFDSIIREDRSLLDLLDCKYTFVNQRLAAHYGLPAVQGSEMRRVDLPDSSRGGILGLAGILTATSFPLRTSPVLRGKWVLEEVLGSKMPPPPPDAGQLPPDDVQADKMSFRQRLEVHRKKAECASCHQRMDPLGFGLENFDAIGRWRVKSLGEPVDAMGVLPSGEKFDGPGQLKAVLMKKKDEFLRNLAHKMLGYALGRELNKFDGCVVKDSMKAMAEGKYHSSILVEQIVLSYPFQFRYAKK